MRVVRQSAPHRENYQAGLEAAFPDWPGREASRWYFERTLHDLPGPDLLSVEDGANAIAGVCVSYRRIQLANGSALVAAILTAAWTLPAARGRGCFSRLVEAAQSSALEREAAVLLAFVTRSNGSYGALVRAGHAALPSRYWLAKAQTPVEPRRESKIIQDRTLPADLEAIAGRSRSGLTHVRYSDLAEWRSQFLARPFPTAVVEAAPGLYAILEQTSRADRVLTFVGDLARRELGLARLLERAQRSGRDLFWFELESEGTPATRPGFGTFEGAMTIKPIALRQLGAALSIPTAATVQAEKLIDPASPWYIGPWSLESGDRM